MTNGLGSHPPHKGVELGVCVARAAEEIAVTREASPEAVRKADSSGMDDCFVETNASL